MLHGAIDADTAPFHRVLSPKLPVLGGLPLQPADAAAPNSYYFSSGQFGALGVVTYAKTYARAEKVSLLTTEGFAASERAVAAIKQGLEASGVKVTVARYPANSTDLSEPLAASGAADADLFVPVVADAAHCVNIQNALQQLADQHAGAHARRLPEPGGPHQARRLPALELHDLQHQRGGQRRRRHARRGSCARSRSGSRR